MTILLDFLILLRLTLRAYHLAKQAARQGNPASAYSAACDQHGVPQVAVFCAVGRDAWRVSQRAFDEFEVRESGKL